MVIWRKPAVTAPASTSSCRQRLTDWRDRPVMAATCACEIRKGRASSGPSMIGFRCVHSRSSRDATRLLRAGPDDVLGEVEQIDGPLQRQADQAQDVARLAVDDLQDVLAPDEQHA